MKEVTVTSQEALNTLAEEVCSVLPRKETGATVLALHGELGAGKTAFTQALGELLGVTDYITSPTFILMRRYDIPAHDFFTELIHIDAYRLEEAIEANVLRIDELLADVHNLLVIEWAERVADMLPDDTVHMSFTHTGDETRTVAYGIER